MKTISKDIFRTWGMVVLPFVCLCCGFPLLAFLGPRIDEEWTVYQRKQDLPEVEAEFNALVDDLPRSEFDTVLSIHTHSLTIGRESGCIWGYTVIIYGSTRDFEVVASEYETLFADRKDWTQTAGLDSNFMGYSHSMGKADFLLYFYEPSDSLYPPECAGFPTCYSADLYYADPARAGCSG